MFAIFLQTPNMKEHFVFFGSSEFSVTVLKTLEKQGLLPAVIVTTPDMPKGRTLSVMPPLVKIWGSAKNIPVLQPERLDSGFLAKLREFKFDVFLVASYGKILPQSLLEMPKSGAVNIHPSLLPKFRGATPIQSAILAGETATGVSLMLMDEKMDHGPIFG